MGFGGIRVKDLMGVLFCAKREVRHIQSPITTGPKPSAPNPIGPKTVSPKNLGPNPIPPNPIRTPTKRGPVAHRGQNHQPSFAKSPQICQSKPRPQDYILIGYPTFWPLAMTLSRCWERSSGLVGLCNLLQLF